MPSSDPSAPTPLRVAITTFGSHGDVHPFLGLALRLRERGHEVLFFSASPFRKMVERYGIEFVAIGTDDQFETIQNDPNLWHPTRAFPTIARALTAGLEVSYDTIAERLSRPVAAASGRTVLVGSTLALATRVLRDRTGLPMATVHLAPAVFRSTFRPPRLPGLWLPEFLPRWWKRLVWALGDRVVLDRLLGPGINALREREGLDPVRGIFGPWLNSPDRVIGFFPELFRSPEPDWPNQTRLVGFPFFDESDGETSPPPEVQRFLADGEPPIVFTAGSANRHAAEFFLESSRACEKMGRRGVLLTQHAPDVPADLPTGVAHFSYVPFSQVLPRVAALVHHGGIGTTAQAMRAGIPQLIHPLAHDQFDNAEILRRLGIGAELKPKHYRAPRVATALRQLLDAPGLQTRLASFEPRFREQDARAEACVLIEALDRSRSNP